MSTLDHIVQRLRAAREEGGRRSGSEVLGRFLVTKLSWRGSYRRLLCITPTHITTLYPDTLAVTNSWAFAGDHDLAGVEVGGDHAEGGLLTLHFRRDKKGLGSKDVKLACKERAALLSLLYRCVELAVARGTCGLGPTLLGQADEFRGHKLRKGRWQPVLLRVSAHAVERVDPASGLVKWRLDYRHMASPAARLLQPGEGQPAGSAAFALFGKTGRSPRVFCCPAREQLLRAVQTAALRKLGLTLAVDSNAALDGGALLAAVAAAERERAATAADAPLGEWEVMRVRELPEGAELDAAQAAGAGGGAADGGGGGGGGWSAVAQRRLVLTRGGLLERRPGDYEVAEWRQLPAVAALVRHGEDPQWLSVEWADGAPPATYVTPARDALLAALLDAAQAAAGRPVPVLMQPTAAGDPILSQRAQALGAPSVAPDAELERLCLQQLGDAARSFMAAGGASNSLAALAAAGLPATLAAAAADGAAAEGEGSGGVAAPSGRPSSPSAAPSASGRSGFMHRAFARQVPAPGAGITSASGAAAAARSPASASAVAAFQQRVREFNACVPYCGLQPGCRVDDVAILALLAHLPRQQPSGAGLPPDEARLAVAALQALQRLAAAPVAVSHKGGGGVVGMAQIVGAAGGAGRVFAALMAGHDHVAAEAARLLLRFFAPSAARAGAGPWAAPPGGGGGGEPAEEEVAAAHAAKSVCFISRSRCTALVRVLQGRRPAPLLSMAVAEAVAAVACEPGSRSTEQATLEAVLQETAALGRPLFALFSHPAPRVAHAAALVMRAVAEGGTEAAQPMREAALTEGAILTHLLSALSPRGGAGEAAAALSRDLVALWADEFAPALGLLRRVFPPGLLRFLNQRRQAAAPQQGPPAQAAAAAAAGAQAGQAAPPSGAVPLAAQQQQQPNGAAVSLPAQPPPAPPGGDPLQQPAMPQQDAAAAQQQQQQQQGQQQQGAPSPVGRRLLEPAPPPRPGTLKGNWEAFWAAAARDHSHAALIWNEGTRAELRQALQAEEAALRLARLRAADAGSLAAAGGGGGLSWNHAEFRVAYPSLEKHLCIGGIYVRLLLEAPANSGGGGSSVVERLPAPREFFAAAHHRLLCLGDASLAPAGAGADRELCARAMAAAYHAHAGAIGPVEGIAHLAALLDATPSRPLRQHLLLLLEALVAPGALATSKADEGADGVAGAVREAAVRAAHANGVALLEARGVELMVDVLAAAHEASERPAAALQTNLIAGSSHAEESREWFYFPAAGAGGGQAQQDGRVGPVTKAEIRQLHSSGAIDGSTPFWASGMPEPLPLASLRELRWWVARGVAPLTALRAAGVALRVLQALAGQQPAVDGHTGEALFPLPLAHRQMASPACLPHIAQVILTGEPALVSAAASLLLTVLERNRDALAELHKTGLHFFALAYCGSNLRELARLLKVCHLAGAAAAGVPPSVPLAQRSILGGLLPESLLHMLESYGPDAFAAALAGDAETPELVWTAGMRGQRLVPQMLRHLGGFPGRLRESCHALYDYTPCPPVGYPEIEGEVWCHRYYLRHLCDEARHPGWPLADHVELLQSLLDAWRAELARQPMGMSEGEACGVLGITPGPDGTVAEEELKAAYRRLARLYHPDKNPGGREQFMGVQAAYERLQAGAAGGQGPQPWRIRLILQAQCLLFRRCPEVLAPFKYAGFPLLLQAVALPQQDGEHGGPSAEHFLSPEAAPQLQAATELCWLTCAASRLNGEELTRAGGLRLLGALLRRCAAVLPRDAPPRAPAAVVATHALRALAVMAAFENARAELEGSAPLVADIVRCCGLERAPAAVEAALLCLARCCVSSGLQELLLRSGVLGFVVPLLLAYDATHAEADAAAAAGGGDALLPRQALPGAEDAGAVLQLPLERSSAQATKNLHAQLAVRTLAALAGYARPPSDDGATAAPPTPPCAPAQRALAALLTQTLAPRLADPDPLPLLRDLNSSLQTPQVIWNSSMRQELLEVLEAQRGAAGQPVAGDGAAAVEALDGFRFKCLRGELVVAGVFVRLYAEQPGFQLSDPPAFCKALVTYIYQEQQAGDEKAEQQQQQGQQGQAGSEAAAAAQRREHLLQALRALRSVLEGAPRLLGLLATRTAVDPLLQCLRPAVEAGLPGGAAWTDAAAADPASAAAELAAAPPVWAAPGAAPAGVGAGVGVNGVGAAELEGAELALTVLLRLTAHAGCLEALGQDKCVAQALWLAHRAPSAAAMLLALRLLTALAGTAAAAWGAAAHGGALFLLTLLLPAYPVPDEQRESFEAARVAAAALLSRLSAHALHGARVSLILAKILPPGLVSAIQDGPGEAAVAALGQASETPERVWSRGMQRAAAEEAAHAAAAARAAQAGGGALEWQLPDGFRMRYRELEGELMVGGVYVRLYLKDPRYPLRNPKAFLEGLLERYVAELQRSTPAAQLGSPSKPATALAVTTAAANSAAAATDGQLAGAGADLALLLSAAAVALLQAQPALGDHAAGLGYVEKAVRLLAARAPPLPGGALEPEALREAPLLPDDVSGSLLRLLHQLASCLPAAEALARCVPPAVPPLAAALRWGTAAAVLALEALKRALAPANRWRDSLVTGCLSVGLVPVLLRRLDWRRGGEGQEGQEERDASVQRVLCVDVLNLLALETQEGGGGPSQRVRALLDASDVWSAYAGQRHDLFLPAGGSNAGGVAGLLQGPGAARFALPPALTAPPQAPVPSPAPQPAQAAVPAAAPLLQPGPPAAAEPEPAAAPELAELPGRTLPPPGEVAAQEAASQEPALQKAPAAALPTQQQSQPTQQAQQADQQHTQQTLPPGLVEPAAAPQSGGEDPLAALAGDQVEAQPTRQTAPQAPASPGRPETAAAAPAAAPQPSPPSRSQLAHAPTAAPAVAPVQAQPPARPAAQAVARAAPAAHSPRDAAPASPAAGDPLAATSAPPDPLSPPASSSASRAREPAPLLPGRISGASSSGLGPLGGPAAASGEAGGSAGLKLPAAGAQSPSALPGATGSSSGSGSKDWGPLGPLG